ncbi:hypothetical protein RhiirA1_443045 [Rhizophagus irregularis]|uniref:Uncharacterized protein n=1 Tax=Rhizophagus irregularis TaxID=588596 RepID=A0A2N0RL50_9GLOM|nr:hypothetical protein RhiirA1_443045 [Rhizophagus irregularis]
MSDKKFIIYFWFGNSLSLNKMRINKVCKENLNDYGGLNAIIINYIKSNLESELHSSNSVKVENSTQVKHGDPSTSNKLVIQPEMKQLYPHISFIKKVKFTIEEPEDENSIESKNLREKDINKNINWRKWLKNVLEVSKMATYEK